VLGLICGWIGYKISESKSSEIIATKDTSIGNLNTKLTDSEKANDRWQIQSPSIMLFVECWLKTIWFGHCSGEHCPYCLQTLPKKAWSFGN
jgi:hypothetical protein